MTGFRVADRVKETSTPTGLPAAGPLTLAGAVTGFQSFNSGIGDGASTTFVIEDGTHWEVSVGKYTHSGTTLSRDTLIASSTGSEIDWSAGTKNVFISEPSTAVLQGTVVKTASYTALASDSVILCNPGAAMTVTLPSAASATLGIRYLIKKIDTSAYVVTISDGASADVDHASSSKLYLEGDSIELVCAYNGSGYEWLALSKSLRKHSASLRQTSSQSPSSGYFTVEFDEVDFEYGVDADLTNERIEIKRAGVYDVLAYVSMDNISTGTANIYIGLNGVAAGNLQILAHGNVSGNNYLAGSMILDLDAGDVVYAVGWHNEMGGVSTIVSAVRLQPRLQVSEV